MKKYHVGEKLLFVSDDFDGRQKVECNVTEVYPDHVIAVGMENVSYWIDNDTEYLFEKM